MGTNRGKEFESVIKKAFDLVPKTNVIRLYDTMNGYVNVSNPCDFVVYKYPHQYLIECKCCYGASLPFNNISDYQWESLVLADTILGVIAGFMIWFIDKDVTVFVRASSMDVYQKVKGTKSFSYKDAEEYGTIVPGKKRKIFWDYDMSTFMKEVNDDIERNN